MARRQLEASHAAFSLYISPTLLLPSNSIGTIFPSPFLLQSVVAHGHGQKEVVLSNKRSVEILVWPPFVESGMGKGRASFGGS